MSSITGSPGLIDAQGVLVADLECKRCGYNLRGLHQEGRCPECGTPIGLSTLGDLLRFADPKWLDEVALGLKILLWMLLGMIVLTVVGTLLLGASPVVDLILAFGVALIEFYAMWLVTTPDPSGFGEDPNLTARKVVRAALVIGLLFYAAQLTCCAVLSGSLAEVMQACLALGQCAADVVATFATYVYYERLARRIPDAALARRARLLSWGLASALGVLGFGDAAVALPASVGGTALGAGVSVVNCLVGPAGLAFVVFGIMGIILLFRLRRAVAEQARLARATWAAALEGAPTPPIGPGAGR